MTDQTTGGAPASDADAGATATGTTDEQAPEAIIGLVTDGAHALIVAQFPTMDDAQAAYATLQELERTTSLRIDGVVVASCDAEGKVHLGLVTDHSYPVKQDAQGHRKKRSPSCSPTGRPDRLLTRLHSVGSLTVSTDRSPGVPTRCRMPPDN